MASSNLSIRLAAEVLRSLAFGSISGTYAGIGTSFANPARLILMVNTTDELLTLSLDGIHDHFVLPSNGQIIIDITTNHSSMVGVLNLPVGQRIYVKGAPTSGAIYLSVFYGAKS